MTAASDETVNQPTPWEFLPDDDQPRAPVVAAEEAALHIEVPEEPVMTESENEPVTIHYLDDEEAEVPDSSVTVEPIESTATVADLLTRQHYLPPVGD